MERLQQIASQTTASAAPPPAPAHPLDPLSIAEIKAVVSVVKAKYGSGAEISFNTVTLKEPSKKSF